tara:strand:- start:651 stop:1172 length:522 start_codon:yes stop_codon:yes gene_type:complete
MKIKIEKFNGSTKFLDDLSNVVSKLPYFTKPSKQKTKIGSLVFDPVKTNNYFKETLVERGWKPNVKIPSSFRHMGKDVDFLKDGVVMEVQFSNYPFLLNNIIRTELFKKSSLKLDDSFVHELIIITKTKDIPSANSSLYFEQAKNQITSIIEYNMIDLPITLIGLYENERTCR